MSLAALGQLAQTLQQLDPQALIPPCALCVAQLPDDGDHIPLGWWVAQGYVRRAEGLLNGSTLCRPHLRSQALPGQLSARLDTKEKTA